MKKSLLILTGHSKGLGKALLKRFLSEGNYQVVAVSRTTVDIEHDNLTQVKVDLSDLDALEDKLQEVFPSGDYEKIILINNAGRIGEVRPLGKLNPDEIRTAMKLNLVAPMVLANAFVKAYLPVEAEKIICNISSGAANKPTVGWAEYCSSKAGLTMFSKVSAEDLREKGFRVFAVAPGIVDTDMQAEIRTADREDFPALDRFKGFKTERKLLTPKVVAAKIFYLLSNPVLFSEVVQDVREFELP
jgi:benzil reductase ((S)-benzoin forming)